MNLTEALRKALDEVASDTASEITAKTDEIFRELETASPDVVKRFIENLQYSVNEVLARRPDAIEIVAIQYLAIGIHLGRRTKELEDASSRLTCGG